MDLNIYSLLDFFITLRNFDEKDLADWLKKPPKLISANFDIPVNAAIENFKCFCIM